jgi:hypothetical protein
MIRQRDGTQSFDWSYQPSLDKKQLQTLASCRFIETGENVILLGPPGVGNPPRGRPGAQGHPARLPGALHHGGRHDRHPD